MKEIWVSRARCWERVIFFLALLLTGIRRRSFSEGGGQVKGGNVKNFLWQPAAGWRMMGTRLTTQFRRL